jgi:heptosyltransferase II
VFAGPAGVEGLTPRLLHHHRRPSVFERHFFEHTRDRRHYSTVGRQHVVRFLSLPGSLKKKKFALGLLFTNSFQSALLFKLAGIPRLIGYGNEGRSPLLARRLTRTRDHEHQQYYYLKLSELICGHELQPGPDAIALRLTAAEHASRPGLLTRLGLDPGRPVIGFAPTAAYGGAKAWPAERFIAVWRILKERHPDWQAIVLASAKERPQTAAFADLETLDLHNLAGTLALRDSLIALAGCAYFISNDSGLMHVAAGLNVPLVAVFGPTRPEKTAPLGRAQILLHKPVPCAPCAARECPRDHACMLAISPTDVVEALERVGGGQ